MRTILFEETIKNLDLSKNLIDRGNHAKVYKIELNDKEYCYKEFIKPYPIDMISNMSRLTNIDFDRQFITPLYMVMYYKQHILGYIMNYDENLDSIQNNNKIKLLKDMRNLIDILHSEYKIIHCDLVEENMLFDNKNLKSYIIDFDASVRKGRELSNYSYIRLFIEDYVNAYGFNYGLDIYSFNIATLMILNNYDYIESLLDDIKDKQIEFINNSNKDIKKLSKELLLNNTRKKYSNEYIIDYID